MFARSIFRLTRKAVAWSRVLPTFTLSREDRDVWWKWKSPRFDDVSNVVYYDKARAKKKTYI